MKNIKNYIIEDNRGSKTTVLFIQGGPSNRLLTDPQINIKTLPKPIHGYYRAINFLKNKILKKINFVQIKQVQNLRLLKPIDIKEAQELQNENILIINNVCKYYKNQGHKVIIIGHSYGSYILNEYIYQYGTKNVDLILLANSRLNTPKIVAKNIEHKKSFTWFGDNGNIKSTEKYKDSINLKNLYASLLYKNYTKLLRKTDLSKILLLASVGDKWMGTISQEEINFLKKQKAKVILCKLWYTRLFTLIFGKHLTRREIAHYTLFSFPLMHHIKNIIKKISLKPNY